MQSIHISAAINDMRRGLGLLGLACFLAYEDIRQRYVRTLLGPLWIVLSTAIWFSVMGFVMANLFGQDLHTYLPFMTSGLLVWMLISTSIAESTYILIAAGPLITTFNLPIFVHYLRFAIRNLIIFLHNVIILVIVFALFPPAWTTTNTLALPGLLLDIVILFGLSTTLSLLNLRYRDTSLAIASALQILPFVTPIFWDKPMLKGHPWIADVNPFFHMLEIVRAPLMGQAPEPISWIFATVMAVVMMALSLTLFARYRHRIVFWL